MTLQIGFFFAGTLSMFSALGVYFYKAIADKHFQSIYNLAKGTNRVSDDEWATEQMKPWFVNAFFNYEYIRFFAVIFYMAGLYMTAWYASMELMAIGVVAAYCSYHVLILKMKSKFQLLVLIAFIVSIVLDLVLLYQLAN